MEHKGTQTIETKRLILRRFTPEDGDAMFRNWASDPQVTKFLTWPTHDNAEVSHRIAREWSEGYSDPEFYQWAIVPKAVGEPVGAISAVHVDNRTESAHIGYCIGREWWGQGITAEALTALVSYFFDEVGMNSLNARHDPSNPNSGKVMLKSGMTRDGRMRAFDTNNSGICDKVWYSITREDYEMIKRYRGSIRNISDPGQKCGISRDILEALPDWFAVRESRERYIAESAGQPFFAAYDGDKPVGFLCLKETGKETVEISVMGVLKEYHRKGLGRALFFFAKQFAAEKGYSFMQVKTVQMGIYDDYDDTNRFYRSIGFKELEVFPTLWDGANPCQIYVMSIG